MFIINRNKTLKTKRRVMKMNLKHLSMYLNYTPPKWKNKLMEEEKLTDFHPLLIDYDDYFTTK